MKILGIETSCDETGVAVFDSSQKKIIWEKTATQIKIHQKTSGIIPEVASRIHAETLPIMIHELKQKINIKKIDSLAVAHSPGLLGSLLVGVNFAKMLAFLWQKPIIPVNHLIAHFYSALLSKPAKKLKFPILGLVVSGGHTILILANAKDKFKVIGSTRDDAAGEAFDKTARLIKLGYPGGPAIEKEAAKIKKSRFHFTPPMLNSGDFDFSFSGLKTEVVRTVQKTKITAENKKELAKAIQNAIITSLVEKTFSAVAKYKPKSFLLGGGVAANQAFRDALYQKLLKVLPKKEILFCEKKYAGDNASIIALAGYFLKKHQVPWYSVKALAENSLLYE